MDARYAVVTAVGEDRVGIVRDLASAVERSGCNIEESRMAVLGGDFAVIMLVSGSAPHLEGLTHAAPALGAETGLQVQIHTTRPPRRGGAGRPYVLESVSLDAPGIVHAVSELLRRRGVNIEALDTETASAPWTGAQMFRMRANVVIPAGVSPGELRRELEELELERDLDIVLRPAIAPTDQS